MDNIKTIYHGSVGIVKNPLHGYGKGNNDYGIGFYCTEDSTLGNLWAVNIGGDGYNNKYEMNLDGLNILKLSEDNILF